MERQMFVIGNSFKPFSMQEMLVPFQLYKDAFDKTEAAYAELSDKADAFKYLSDTLPEGSKSRDIYEGYANGLAQQAEDLAHNGLSMSNRRALASYKRRYAGEIGRLSKADEALQEERKRRLALSTNDPSTLYATNNLNIDNFLDGNKPNTYSVSGDSLYKRGLEIGASVSSRMYGNPQIEKLTNAYDNIIQTQGITPELMARFQKDLSAIPEFQHAIDATLKEKGVTDNLTGIEYERARQSVFNGIVNGAIYKRSNDIKQNPDYISAYQQAQLDKAQDSFNLQAATAGRKKDSDGNWVVANDSTEAPPGTYWDPQDGKYKKIPRGYKPDPNSPIGISEDENYSTADKQRKLEQQSTLDNKLLALTKSDLAHNSGFDVVTGDTKHHYRYIAALSKHGGKWYSGRLGEDNPGHKGFGFMSSSNVENKWGNFSAEDIDGRDSGDRRVRVLSKDEIGDIVDNGVEYERDKNGKLLLDAENNPIPKLDANNQPIIIPGSILSKINEALSRENLNMQDSNLDIRLVVVPNESDSSKDGYFIAVKS